MMEEFVITGIGIVSSAGIGKEAFWDAMLNTRTGLRDIAGFDTSGKKSHIGGEIRGFDLDSVFPDKRFRRAADISKYCLASCRLAIDDAGLDSKKWDGAKVGIVVGVTHGAINYSREFYASLIKEGPSAISPMFFSDSVLNAPAGNASFAFNVKGAVHTIVGDTHAGIAAVNHAVRVMQNDNLDICIAGCAEEIDSLVFDSYARFKLLSPNNGKKEEIKPFGIDRNGFIVGEGACMLVIENKKAAIDRRARIYAEIDAKKWGDDRWLDGGIYISTGANGTENDIMEAEILKKNFGDIGAQPFIGNIKPIVGECFAAGSSMQIALSSMALYNGIIPPSTLHGYDLIPEIRWGRFNRYAEQVDVKRAIVSSTGIGRGTAFLLLKELG